MCLGCASMFHCSPRNIKGRLSARAGGAILLPTALAKERGGRRNPPLRPAEAKKEKERERERGQGWASRTHPLAVRREGERERG